MGGGGHGGQSPQERMAHVAAQVDTDILVEKEQTIMELRDTVEVGVGMFGCGDTEVVGGTVGVGYGGGGVEGGGTFPFVHSFIRSFVTSSLSQPHPLFLSLSLPSRPPPPHPPLKSIRIHTGTPAHRHTIRTRCQILELKIKKLEQLVRLKDSKIHTMQVNRL
jgi:hypothetical protein